MKDKLNVAVIGVGTFGSMHAKIYSQMDMCELKAVADINQKRLDEVCHMLKVEGYTDYQELLARDDIDAVNICTTDELHVEPAVTAANMGKHVFVEKPLARTPQDCDKIIKAAKDSDVKLTVGHILRFDPRYVTAYEKIKNNTIGKLVHLFVRRNNPITNAKRLSKHTSVLFFLGIHDIDFMNWCVGKKAKKVYAEATYKKLKNTPDTVLATIRFSDDTIALLEASWILPESFPGKLDAKFEVIGTDGVIYVDGGSDTVEIAHQRFESPELFYAPELFGERVGILRDELTHFVECIVNDREPIVSGEDGKAAVEVAYTIQKSFETGNIVEVG